MKTRRFFLIAIVLLCVTVSLNAQAQQLIPSRLSAVERIVNEGLQSKQMPGCVVLIQHQGKIHYLKAFGNRQLKPVSDPMTIDTVFDLASLTKPIATATCVMKMIETGDLKPNDRVKKHWPEFGQNGKAEVTIQQLLTHTSGLIPDNALSDYDLGTQVAMDRIAGLQLRAEPGSRFMYSDVGFIVLAELIRRRTGQNVEQYSEAHFFQPLGMFETGYRPPLSIRDRCAVTQKVDGRWLKGEVHDPRAFRMDGVAGHAGLFSTATDLARFAQMLLNKGTLDGCRVLKPETVRLMTSPVQVPGGLRTAGWDNRSAYSSNRGDLLSDAAFGHGGFTGTAMWIDPAQQLIVIFLSNRVHPDGKGSVNRLAGRIATVAAAAIPSSR